MIPWKIKVLIFELFKQTAFIDSDNDSNGSDDCEKRDKLIICNNTLFGQMFVGTMLCNWSVKAKILSNFVGFALIQNMHKKCKILLKETFSSSIMNFI